MDVLSRNNVRIMGEGQPLMFGNGMIGDQSFWRFIVPEFTQHYKVILFDYVGSGGSDKSAYDESKYSSFDGYARDVIDICESLDLKNLIFVGHSVSSMISLVAAIQRPQYFSDLIFIAPSPCYINDSEYKGGFDKIEIDMLLQKMENEFEVWAREIAPAAINAANKPALSNELVATILNAEQRVVKRFAITTFFSDYRKALLELKIRSLILQCSEDFMAPLQVGDYMHAHLQDSQLIRLEAKGHFPHLTSPEEVVKAIRTYLRKKRK